MTTVVILSMTAAAVAVAAPAQAANTAQDGVNVADGHTGSVDQGREDNDDQQYPLNFTVKPSPRSPGSSNGGAEFYAVGLTENVQLHWIVVTSQEFGLSNCEPQDAKAFGIDRGNDNPGTQTDESLLTSYKSYNSGPNQIKIGYYQGDALAGQPVNITVQDQIVASNDGCLKNPKQKGWYRIKGKVNGSTKMDDQTDYTIRAGTQWIYICDCKNRQEAKQKLGPPPSQSGGGNSGGGGSNATATSGGDQTPTPTATSGGGGGGTNATATTGGGGGAGDVESTANGTANGTETTPATGTTDGGTATGDGGTPTGTSGGGGTDASPTDDGGPGFGLAAAAGAVLAVSALLRRRG